MPEGYKTRLKHTKKAVRPGVSRKGPPERLNVLISKIPYAHFVA